MSKITIQISSVPPDRKLDAIARLRRTTGRPLGQIQRCLTGADPIAVEEIFYNDHDEVAARLRQLLVDLAAVGASFQVFEAAHDGGPGRTYHEPDEIVPDVLLDILRASEERDPDREHGDLDGAGHD